ncbi:unnamed protein product [Nippostrongylus brasiliensis]|uniref:Saposin B-type domain-containing protein n=1 Tax=Nippostrongylus brasiliensis TaxID=27835 RepID=A0A0N4YM04_NIPBR|nr:unnamed protein product [Nippostrongylus brasiliensis]
MPIGFILPLAAVVWIASACSMQSQGYLESLMSATESSGYTEASPSLDDCVFPCEEKMCQAISIFEEVLEAEHEQKTTTVYKCNILKSVTMKTDNGRDNPNTLCYEYTPDIQ